MYKAIIILMYVYNINPKDLKYIPEIDVEIANYVLEDFSSCLIN